MGRIMVFTRIKELFEKLSRDSFGFREHSAQIDLNSKLSSALTTTTLDCALAGRGLHTRKKAVFSGSLALFWLVCCRHYSKQVINTL